MLALKAALALLSALSVLAGGAFLVFADPQPPAAAQPEPTTAPITTAEELPAPPRPEPAPLRERASGPATTMMKLTVPRMERVRDVPVKTAPPDDDPTLDRGALHVEGTGFPWQEGSNVYVAGHRLGYPATGSYLLFYDLPVLEDGDRVILEDSDRNTYTYRVFRRLRVDPSDVSVTRPVPGKSVVSLQSCTLPAYKQRLVVQAELVAGAPRPGEPPDAFGL